MQFISGSELICNGVKNNNVSKTTLSETLFQNPETMKRQRLTLICFILLISIQFCFGQEKSELMHFGSTFPYNCELVNGYVDFLINELEKNPNSIGYIVINRQRQKPKQFNQSGFYYEDIISIQIKRRSFNKNRLQIIRSESDKLKIDFYIASDESSKPNFTEAKWDLYIPSKPILFDEGYGGQLCEETSFRLNTFSEILAAHPNARGHFVIYAESFKDFPKKKESIMKEIIKAGISVNRFKFFFRKDNSTIYPHAELWLVPKMRK